MSDYWRFLEHVLRERLAEEDDPSFWQAALDCILGDTVAEAGAYSGKEAILVEIGRCSHWIQPHRQGPSGIAWPFGYGNVGQGFSYKSLPELDWSFRWGWHPATDEWLRTKGQPSRRPLIRRIALPARTSKHPQGTVHTIWLPGSPEEPRHKLTSVYGFKKDRTGWRPTVRWEKGNSKRVEWEMM